jgi:cullin-associated NEDD8-dissociated protein 1
MSSCNIGNFILHDGQYYQHDARLELLPNTLEEPTVGSEGTCPTAVAPKTFLNKESCTLQPSCTAFQPQVASFQLNKSTMELFFTEAQKYVYVITGLRAEASPCGTLSRWKRLDCATANCAASSTSSALASALGTQEGWLRDVDVECDGSSVPAGTVLQVGADDYFQHVHLHEYNVYDFSAWVYAHPGGQVFISKWTGEDFELLYPSNHPMSRWEGSAQSHLHFLGKLDDSLDFESLPASFQTKSLLAALSPSAGMASDGLFESCGSPGEVGNRPAAGNQLAFYADFVGGDDRYHDVDYDFPETTLSSGNHDLARTTVWTMRALEGEDQLRQRMAWALSQIFVAGSPGYGNGGYTEMWVNYYDIFVRNAFGSYRDVLREVTYSPVMGSYLTFLKNTAYDHNHNYPDENYAREIMQLFTIGLWELHPNGTRVLDAHGEPVPTYDNVDIMNFARVFTGFDEQLLRPNIEKMKGTQNKIDPMQMVATWHDVYPKSDLDGGYLGDAYPLCSDLPERSFLEKGAHYEFLGYSYDGVEVLVVGPSSGLFTALRPGGQFALTVELGSTIPCHAEECDMDTVRVVRVAGGYYEYVPPTCVHFYFANGQVATKGGNQFKREKHTKCANPDTAVAGISCCGGCTNDVYNWMTNNDHTCEGASESWPEMYTTKCNQNPNWQTSKYCQYSCWQHGVGYDGDNCSAGLYHEERICGYPQERVRFARAKDACAAVGLEVCPTQTATGNCSLDTIEVWTPETCSFSIEVDMQGRVAAQTDTDTKQNKFSVQWLGGHPTPGACPSECTNSTEGCTCDVHVEVQAVFSGLPSKAELQAKLRIGALPPAVPCTVCEGDVKMYASSGAIDVNTVFECDGGFFKNAESLVHVDGGFTFRNPPIFMVADFPKDERAALAEVESLLDHLFHHHNTPVFVAYRLLQRLVTSNPSPAYVKDVAEAFSTGLAGGTVYGSGAYGDLAATVAAILLHPEARSSEAENPAALGALREPLLKVIHLLRAMEYTSSDQRETVLEDLTDVIGQWPYQSPSVFNYYTVDYQPTRFADGIVSPEFQIFTPPLLAGFLNGMMSIIEHGVSNCDKGFGRSTASCSESGSLTFEEQGSANETLEQLDLLLTGGRLSSKEVVREAYETALPGDGLKAAMRTMVMTPEFHTLGNVSQVGARPTKAPEQVSAPSSYKATVMLFLAGGADTFNMLVPLHCNLHNEYLQVRGNIALEQSQLHEITTDGQACSQFGIHHKLPFLKELYDKKKASFVSNVGALVEPTTKEQLKDGTVAKCVGLYSHSDQQIAAQTLKCQTAGASP